MAVETVIENRATFHKLQNQEQAVFEDVVEALVGLGYSRPDSRKAAERAIANATDKSNTAGLMRDALNLLTASGRR